MLVPKKVRVQISLSQVSMDLLEDMAKQKGLSKSVLIDLAIQNEYKENERKETEQPEQP